MSRRIRLMAALPLLLLIGGGCLPWGPVSPCEKTTWYPDPDGDGYGSNYSPDSMMACDAPRGYVSRSGDCAEGDPLMNPETLEECDDFIDNNCSQEIDEGCEFFAADESIRKRDEPSPLPREVSQTFLRTANPCPLFATHANGAPPSGAFRGDQAHDTDSLRASL